MNVQQLQANFIGLIIFFLVLHALIVPALAKVTEILPENSVYELWNTLDEFQDTKSLESVLRSYGWVSDSVSSEDLDHILVMTQQLHEQLFPELPVSLVIAVISMESSFQQDLVGFSNDSGLMQVIPRFHKERIAKYLWDDSVDIFDIRVNIGTGMDYLSELYESTGGDMAFTLMCYNQGPDSAANSYATGYVSYYAREVLERMGYISDALHERTGGVTNGQTETTS